MRLSNLYPIKAKALIYQGELDYISKCALDYPNIETGGDLFGFWTHSGYPVIQYVIGPGPSSNHQVAFFNQDIYYLNEIGSRLRGTHGLQHIGEWHSHHQLGLAEPSGHDVTTVTKAIQQYNLGKFFLVIANIRNNSSSANGFMFEKNKGRNFEYAGWVILNGESPIRKEFDDGNRQLIYFPKVQQSSLLNLSETTLNDFEYVKPEYSPEYWLHDKANHYTLKSIFDTLNYMFNNVQLFQTDTEKTIYFVLETSYGKYQIDFPFNFPNIPPSLKTLDEDEGVVELASLHWKDEKDISTSVIRYIKQALEEHNLKKTKTKEKIL